MEKFLQIYNDTNRKLKSINFAFAVIGWDSQTEAPKECFDYRSKQLGTLSEMSYVLQTSKEYVEAINHLYLERENLDKVLSHEIERMKKGVDQIQKVPMDEYVKYCQLMGKSEAIYFEAKQTGDYEIFKPLLGEIVDFKKKYIKWLSTPSKKGYNVVLDEYEEGFTTDDCDKFFAVLKEKIVPFVKTVTKKKLKFNQKWLTKSYPIDKQKEFTNYISQVMCFDLSRGVIKESEHPFTTNTHSKDVRVTNHYYENNFISAIFSAIHEMGHGTYEQQIDEKLDDTMSGGGASFGMHESQSRFYENIIGRSYEFWQTHYEKLQEYYPKQLGKVSLDDFYKGINLAKRSFIRTDADELTYSLHIMLRYDIEKKMLSNKISVDNVPAEWNKLVKKYLGLTVKDDKEGVLQDVHWAGGSFGYFPTYALGSAYAAQIYHKMCQEIDVKQILASGNLKGINEWLKEKIHKYGSTLSPKQILLNATGEEFNPQYYVDYLIEKYSKIYEI